MIEQSGSTDACLKESKHWVTRYCNVTLYGMSSLHLNLLLEINTYRIFYPKNTGSVFNNSDEAYYSVACTDKRRSTRDRYRDWEMRTRLCWMWRKTGECEGHWPLTDAGDRGVFRPRQTRQLPRAVDLKGRLLSCQSY